MKIFQAAILILLTPFVAAQTTPSAETKSHIEAVEACLPPPVAVAGEHADCRTLAQRMADLHVLGLSIAVEHHGTIEWARGYGLTIAGGPAVTPDTLFQAGSISKPVAAMAALHLVQAHKLSLDADINTQLKTWKLPPNPALPDAVVTLRELLTHTGGTTVHGFPGYAAGDPIPTLVQVLNGDKPANTPAIRIEAAPNTRWNYSGGGYTIMQQLLLDTTSTPFPKLLHDTVLAPIGMTHSTYEQPLPSTLRVNAAAPHGFDGQAIPGGAHTYPEMAAAGLWTTPSDLVRYIIENQRSLQGKANHVLSPETTREMLTSGKGNWGLGVEIGGSAANPYFSHGGSNAGYESLYVAYEQGGEGAVIMTNAQGGTRIAEEIMRSIAQAYNWPDFHPIVRTAIKLDPAILARYTGTYQAAPGHEYTFTVEGDHLISETNGQRLPIFPESQTRFFLKPVNAEVEFFTDDNGQVTHLVLYQGGREFKAFKTK